MTARPRLAAADLRIRRAEPTDGDAVAASMATPRAFAGTLQLPFPSPAFWREKMAKPNPDGLVLVAEARTPDGPFEVVASLGLDPVGPSLRRRHAMHLGLSVRDDWQGRGIGRALMIAALERADNWMQVLRIELTVFADNPIAIGLYRDLGFVAEGTHRAFAFRDGAYVDAVSMARLHPRPPALPPTDR